MPEQPVDIATIQQEARRAGVPAGVVPSLDSVRHRRTQLLGTLAFVVCTAAAGLSLLSSPGAADTPAARMHTGVAITLVLAAFGGYAARMEQHLRRLERLVGTERAINVALTQQVYDYQAVLEAARVLYSVLSLDDVGEQLVSTAVEMVGGAGGALHLHGNGGALVPLTTVGLQADPAGELRTGEGLAGRAVATGQAQLVDLMGTAGAPGRRAISSPLVVGDELVGVLTVVAGDARELGSRELHALRLLAEQTAPGLRAARRYELQRQRVTRLFASLEAQPTRLPSGPHDLRTPLNSIISCSRIARDRALPADERAELLAVMTAQSHRLSTMIEDLLSSERTSGLRPTNMTALVSEIAERQRLAGQPIEIHTAQACYAVADADAITRAVAHLVDNAYRYGQPPVQVGIRHHADTVLLSVWDHGSGIPAEDRERVFQRSVRLAGDGEPTLGLGLSIVSQLVAGCGGQVWIDEAPGGGAAVHMSLPTAAHEAVFAR